MTIDDIQILEQTLPPPSLRSGILGHNIAFGRLLNAYNNNKLHHAWLLSGQLGVGKATFAYHAARALLRLGQTHSDFQSAFYDTAQDNVFHKINQNTAANFIYVSRPFDEEKKRYKTVIPVDKIRNVIDFFQKTPTDEKTWRVCIIDSVDDMNTNAANALLKVLEEPPARTIFFLVSHQRAKALPTLQSRCQILPFHSLSQEHIQKIIGFPPSSLCLGSVRYAMLLNRPIFAKIEYAIRQSLATHQPLTSLFPFTDFFNLMDNTPNDENYYLLLHLLFCGIVREKTVAGYERPAINVLYASLWEKLNRYFAEAAQLQAHLVGCIGSAIATIDEFLYDPSGVLR